MGPHVTQTRGIDISSRMVERYNNMAETSNLSRQTAHAVAGNLFTVEAPAASMLTQELYDFDIASVGFGFHHFEDTGLAIRRLAERLKPGGVVLIIDFADQVHLPSRADSTIKAHGFTEEEMKRIFENEGLQNIGWSVMDEEIELRMDPNKATKRKVFLGRAQKRG